MTETMSAGAKARARAIESGWETGWGPDLRAHWATASGGDGDGDAAFDNSAHVPGAQDLPAQWARRAEAFRAALGGRARLGLRYGDHPRAALDLYVPEGTPAGLLVFVHGGYWMRMDRSYFSHLAAGALRAGWAVSMPSYPLTPEVSLAAICRAVGDAISFAAAQVDGPVRLVGHSAGGHLVTRMACADAPLSAPAAARLDRVTSISGLHDLRPFLHAKGMNRTLGLDAAMAAAESPALLAPRGGVRVTAWVGGDERPELIRQSRLLAAAWAPVCDLHIAGGQNHFSVIDALSDPAKLMVFLTLTESDC